MRFARSNSQRGDDMQPITRRRFLQYGIGVGGALGVPWGMRIPDAYAAPAGKLAKYLEAVPLPGAGIVVATRSGVDRYSFTQTQITRQLHPDLPPTPLWAYDDGSGLAGPAGSFGMRAGRVVVLVDNQRKLYCTRRLLGGWPKGKARVGPSFHRWLPSFLSISKS